MLELLDLLLVMVAAMVGTGLVIVGLVAFAYFKLSAYASQVSPLSLMGGMGGLGGGQGQRGSDEQEAAEHPWERRKNTTDLFDDE